MIYSLDRLNKMAEGDQNFVISVITVFLEEIPEDLEHLENAIAKRNFDQVYKMAHKIKPNIELLGMEQTKATALEIEILGKSDDNLVVIEEKFPLLKKDIEQVIAELHKDFRIK